ncbi:MAG: M20/M25/M40 family metallo-hydrolase [Thermoleophilia bacterium]|nr:M20/M25/M40 family metallo-hydrolase [Thermoleophilia bacterium]
MAVISLRDEVTALLRELLRLDTVNPPGNETRAAELLRAQLERVGVECRLYARDPARANLVARIPGRDPAAPRLLFLSHTDTVPADRAEWSVDPWSGELRDGQVWGRGALDMKGQVAASAVALATLAREGFEPTGDVIFAATADEEVGEGFGLSWLCSEHPEAVRAAWCVNEGGGDRIELGGKTLYLCATSEKAISPFRLRVFGRSGHASMPAVGDNALVKAARLIDRLDQLETPITLLPETAAFLEAVLGSVPEPDRALGRLAEVAPGSRAMLEPMLRTTVSPTQIRASDRENVIPGSCEVVCDCRLLPGETQSGAGAVIRAALPDGGYELEWLERVGGSRSPFETPLWDALASFVAAEDPGATVVPVLLAGFTDSHFLREAFGTVAYGFFPMRAMAADLAASLVHSADERVPVDDLELGTRCLLHVARELVG